MNAGLTRPNPWILWGGISLMTVIWTLNPIAGKIAMRDFPPMLLVALRTAASGAMIGAVLWFKRRSQPKVARKDWLLLLFFGVGLQVGNQIAFINGLGRTSVAHTAFVYALTPILVLALASYRGQEGFRARKLFGMVICIFGVMLLVRDQAGGEATPLGDAIVFVGIIMFSCFTVFGKELQVRYGGVLLNAFAYMAGGIVLQPVVWLGYPDLGRPVLYGGRTRRTRLPHLLLGAEPRPGLARRGDAVPTPAAGYWLQCAVPRRNRDPDPGHSRRDDSARRLSHRTRLTDSPRDHGGPRSNDSAAGVSPRPRSPSPPA